MTAPASLQHRDIALEHVTLHCVEAGSGPLVLLLHGFPEFWYTWRHVIPALAGAGFRVVAPDLRGVNTSSKPSAVRAYGIRSLTQDIEQLIQALGVERAHVVGHDWGAGIAWAFAMRYPEHLLRLAVVNGPHPQRLLRALLNPAQLRKSWYMFFFQLPWLPELFGRRHDYAMLLNPMRHGPARAGAYSEADLALYRDALAQPGALTAFFNYYRAMLRPSSAFLPQPIAAEVLVIWGERDPHLLRELARPDPAMVPHARVEYLPEATHWAHHDCPERVAELLIDFLSAAKT